MKSTVFYILTLLLLSALFTAPCANAEDMRDLQVQARQARQALLEKAEAEKKAALQEAANSRQRILADRTRLESAVKSMEAETQRLKADIESLEAESAALYAREEELTRQLAETDGVMRELVGGIRVNAKDILTLIEQNLQSALGDASSEFLTDIAGQARFPGMADIEKMVGVLRDQTDRSGDVRITRGPIIDRFGNAVEAEILVLGNFTAAYRIGEETGFLNYSSPGRKLFALSRLPDNRIQDQIRQYMDGESDAVYMDVTRGGALRQLTHRLSLLEQIPKGGPIVWPILAIFALGVLIVLERTVFLLRKRLDADRLTRRIEALAQEQNWEECGNLCRRYAGKPVARVIAAGVNCCRMKREAMEDALQEAILKEIPPMERFLSTLGMLAAIAPLLGLLGTVTGMIDTFHVITHHGTGDPRMMSGGISEALVTTMLGLSAAIPIMLAHTLLNRAVDTRIGEMEEKAAAVVNIMHKQRNADAC